MPSKYKLTYFNVTGLGEPIRYILSYGNLDFEDVRVEFADWEKMKESTDFGKLPMLEVDGKKITQSAVICRYLAKKLGIAGKDEWDQVQADVIVDTVTDFRLNYTAWFRAPEDQKAEKLKEITDTHNPFYLTRFEKILAANGGTFIKDQLTWADIFYVGITELLVNIVKEDILAPYPKSKALVEKVINLPGIKAYRAKRPKTTM